MTNGWQGYEGSAAEDLSAKYEGLDSNEVHRWLIELYPRAGFIVTNLTRPGNRVVAFYNQRGTLLVERVSGCPAVNRARMGRHLGNVG